MAIYEHMGELAGKPVTDWSPGDALDPAGNVAYRIALDWDEADSGIRWVERFAAFLDQPFAGRITGLIVGAWEQDYDEKERTVAEIIAALIAARDRLPFLRELFLGEMISEEHEISWIEQGDVAPLLAAYPGLAYFAVRGGSGLRFTELRHDALETLIVETGGLPAQVARDIGVARLPALRHLELWLGVADYGGDTTPSDLAPILSGEQFLALTSLGLRDSEIADDLAVAVATAPLTERLEVLDLSLGTLTDAGAAALLASPAVARLRRLDLHHHFCSEEMVARLSALPLEVDLEDRQEPDEDGGETYRYVAVSE